MNYALFVVYSYINNFFIHIVNRVDLEKVDSLEQHRAVFQSFSFTIFTK